MILTIKETALLNQLLMRFDSPGELTGELNALSALYREDPFTSEELSFLTSLIQSLCGGSAFDQSSPRFSRMLSLAGEGGLKALPFVQL